MSADASPPRDDIDKADVTAAHSLRLVFAARSLRDFGDGFLAILLPLYLVRLGFSTLAVGALVAVALLGSALATLAVGAYGHRFERRALLTGAAALMIATGLALAASDAYAILLLVAFAGTVNPSGGSASPFVPIEHAVIADTASDDRRTHAFARYSLVGALAGALGGLAAATPDYLARTGLAESSAFRCMFAIYALMGLLAALLYLSMPAQRARTNVRHAALGPSRGVVYRLAALFSLDAFAGGFAVQSLLALWLFDKFDLSLAIAGAFFFWSGVLSAFSFPVAARLSDRFGLINTMVFTHIPSSLCLIAAAFVSTLWIALALLLVRAALSQMDVPTRSSYVMAVVTEPERTAAASFTAVPRSLAASFSPALAGALFGAAGGALPLVVCGGLKIVYDLLLLRQFRGVKTR